MNTKQHFILSIFLVLFLSAYGCATTKPNKPYSGPYPPTFKIIQQKNPLLASELGKLPEFQDEISESEEEALQKFCDLYIKKQNSFYKVFGEMYKVGIPEVRKYCTPLQALFWLVQENKMDQAISILSNYSLSDMLDVAWNFEQPIFTDQKLKLIVSNIKEQKLREEYEHSIMYNVKRIIIERWILKDYKENRSVFNSEAQKAIKSRLKNPEDSRWKSFKDVTERLNSPELIDYYENRRFSYIPWQAISGYNVSVGNPYWVFKNNGGDCLYTTCFTVYCLTKGGFKAWDSRVRSYNPVHNFHAITVFYWKGKKHVMDNGTTIRYKAGIMTLEDYKVEHSGRFHRKRHK